MKLDYTCDQCKKPFVLEVIEGEDATESTPSSPGYFQPEWCPHCESEVDEDAVDGLIEGEDAKAEWLRDWIQEGDREISGAMSDSLENEKEQRP